MPVVTRPRERGARWAWIAIALACVLSIVAIGGSTPDAGMFVGLSAVIAALGLLLIPGAAFREGSLKAGFLGAALAAHVLGSLTRFVVVQLFYKGVSDANGYFGAGTLLYQQFRSLYPPPFPHTGTPFM